MARFPSMARPPSIARRCGRQFSVAGNFRRRLANACTCSWSGESAPYRDLELTRRRRGMDSMVGAVPSIAARRRALSRWMSSRRPRWSNVEALPVIPRQPPRLLDQIFTPDRAWCAYALVCNFSAYQPACQHSEAIGTHWRSTIKPEQTCAREQHHDRDEQPPNAVVVVRLLHMLAPGWPDAYPPPVARYRASPGACRVGRSILVR